MKILFRVDASSKVGLGHLRRTLALAKALHKRNHSPYFIVDSNGEELAIPLAFPRVDAAQSKARWDTLIVDSYKISPDEYEQLRSTAERSVVITDALDRGLDCDALIDHNLYASEQMYAGRDAHKTKLWVGPKYAMLNEEILHARSSFCVRPVIQKVLLTLGGGNSGKNIRLWLDLLSQTSCSAEIQILTPVPMTLSSSARHRIVCAPADVGAVMSQVDIAISAAGVTSLELACMGLPAVYVVLENNQDPGAIAAEKEGIGFTLGRSENWRPKNIQKMLDQLKDPKVRQRMSDQGQSLVDGLGVSRLAEVLENL